MKYSFPHLKNQPQVDPSTFVANGVHIVGDVTIGADSSIWFNSVLRGDVHYIKIGMRTNIQDGSVVHAAHEVFPAIIGDDVTVGHMALVHACTIGDRCLIGMQSCVMDGVEIGNDCIIAAGALVTPGKKIPDGQLWAGSPARYVRDVTDSEKKDLLISAEKYCALAKEYI